MPLEVAKKTRTAVMMSRQDLADRRMCCLRPAHRLAWYHFRQTGLLLPFASQAAAAEEAAHNEANHFLLTPFLGWTLGDRSDPLDGWDMKQVIATGIRHGVPLNDLYGCLFFHLRRKLQSFLDKWKICRVNIVLSNVDASELAADLRLRKVSLHRIDTRNLADENYEGIKRVLRDWGPLLTSPSSSSSSSSPSSLAAASAAASLHTLEPLLITYFLNWAIFYNELKSLTSLHAAQHFIEPAATTEDFMQATVKGMQWGRSKQGFTELAMRLRKGGDSKMYTFFHDFSKAFNEYLGMQAAFQAAKKVGIERKQKHAAVPHRLFVPVSASSSTTPALHGSLEDLYVYHTLQYNRTMTERFVEWARTN